MPGIIVLKDRLDFLYKGLNHWAFVVSPLAALFFYILIFVFLNPIFNENDDVIMMNIIQGNYTGEQSAYVVFINYALSMTLVAMYKAFPTIGWYGLFMYFVMWIGLSVLLYMLIKLRINIIVKLLMLLFLMNYFLRFALYLQFSTVSILATFSGLSLYVYTKLNKVCGWLPYYVSWFLCLIGYLIRDHTFVIVVFAMMPFIFYLVSNKYIRIKEIIVTMIVMAASLGGFFMVHHNAYNSNSEWKRFLELQQYRQYIHEFTITQATDPITFESVLSSVGWSYNDYILMLNWLFSDKELYSTTAIRSYVQQMTRLQFSFALTYAPIYLFRQLLSPAAILYFLYLLAILAAFVRLIPRASYLMSLGFVVALFILGLLGRLPDRVLSPLLFCYAFSLLLYSREVVGVFLLSKYKKTVLAGIVYFVVVISILAFNVNIMNSNENRTRIAYFNEQVRLLPKTDQDFMIMFPLLLPIQWNSPLDTSMGMRPGTVIFGSWLQQSPHEDAIMKKNGFEDLYTAMFSRDTVSLLTVDLYLPYIREYLRQHYQVEVRFEQINSFPRSDVFATDRVKVYKVRLNS